MARERCDGYGRIKVELRGFSRTWFKDCSGCMRCWDRANFDPDPEGYFAAVSSTVDQPLKKAMAEEPRWARFNDPLYPPGHRLHPCNRYRKV